MVLPLGPVNINRMVTVVSGRAYNPLPYVTLSQTICEPMVNLWVILNNRAVNNLMPWTLVVNKILGRK